MELDKQPLLNLSKSIDVRFFKIIGLLLAIFVHTYYGTKNFELLKFQKLLVSTQYGVQLIFIFCGYKFFKKYKKNNFNIKNSLKYGLQLYLAFTILLSYYLWENFITSRIVYLSFKSEVLDIFLNLTLLQSLLPKICNGIIPGSWIVSCVVLFFAMVFLFFHKLNSFDSYLNFFLVSIVLRFLFVEILIPKISLSNSFDYSYFKYANFFNHLPVLLLGILLYFCEQKNFVNKSLAKPGIFILALLCLFQITLGKAIFFPIHIQFALLFALLFLVLKPFKFLQNDYFLFISKFFKSNIFVIYFCHFPVIFFLQKNGLFDICEDIYASILLNYTLTIGVTLLLSKCITFFIQLTYRPCVSLEA